jgi:YbgC/YbaW family acyl-CoA thioester hydrolase
MKRSDFRFTDRLRVRWAEIDAQQIVFNGHYLMYFDTAIAGYWRALAMPYAQTMVQLGGDLFVRKATLEYEGSARYDEVLDIGVRCARIGNSSILFSGAVFRQDRLLVSCELVYVFADPNTQTSRPVPDALRAVLLGFEAGESMIDLRVDTWGTLGAQIDHRHGVGRRRRELRARPRTEPFRRAARHRSPAAAGAWRGAHWPHGGGEDLARQRCRAGGARRPDASGQGARRHRSAPARANQCAGVLRTRRIHAPGFGIRRGRDTAHRNDPAFVTGRP